MATPCIRCARLLAELDEKDEILLQLREQLATFTSSSKIPNTISSFLTRTEQIIWRLLHSRLEHVVPKETIYNVVYSNAPECDQPELKIIDVFIAKIRAKLSGLERPERILTQWGVGYTMTIVAEDSIELQVLHATKSFYGPHTSLKTVRFSKIYQCALLLAQGSTIKNNSIYTYVGQLRPRTIGEQKKAVISRLREILAQCGMNLILVDGSWRAVKIDQEEKKGIDISTIPCDHTRRVKNPLIKNPS